ncbi:MAG TPA: YeeE/YedE family protein [Candidatus Nesterenkonia stercoripullorum]|uniref:YeeE/YedE family protein n=1 Tax=Candidatus Nesterenkonia stercoripullorum TaxID=2838701 RepID=A0A9D1S309_9MICC|nr:YeeE/YedE family protein [Candidatus Nesterenkonia stercoripullorum]
MIVTGLAVGIVLGIVMQRGRFCVTGMLRDIFLQKSWRTFVALLIVISVHAVGLAALTSAGIISPEAPSFAPAAIIIGGFVFGLGIILAGGCASGTWYRSAEGLVGSWIALAMYALFASAMNTGALAGFNTWMTSWQTNLTTVPALFGISPWIFAIALAVFTGLLVRHFLTKEARLPKPARLEGVPAWKRPLHFYTAGALIGLIGVIAWPLSAATGRNSGLGITTPTGDIANYATTGDDSAINWGVMLVLGLFAGAFFAAKATGEFRIRVPDAKASTRAVVGGSMMGVGAALAGGCTVGNGMVQTSLFSFQGWIALLFIALGVGAGAKLWLKPAVTAPAGAPEPTEVYSTEAGTISAVDAPQEPGRTSREVSAVFGGIAAAPTSVALKSQEGGPSAKLKDLGDRHYALDSLGALCPFPLIEAKDVMKTLTPGDHLVIDFDCTQATEAIPHWAAEDGHEVTDFREQGEASWQITLRKQ